MTRDNTPILVTGAPRSGTTFLGRMLALAPFVSYIDEPFNLQTGLTDIDRAFLYIPSEDPVLSDRYRPVMKHLLAGRSRFRESALPGRSEAALKNLARQAIPSKTHLSYRLQGLDPRKTRPLVKDPMACFSAEYLGRDLGLQVVVILRHPASTIASYKRLGWHYDLSELTSQPLLMDRYLSPMLGNLNLTALTEIEAWSYLWLAIYTVLTDFVSRNPGFILVRHEDLSARPLEEFHLLYDKLNLPFTDRVRRRLVAHTSPENPVDAPESVAHALKRDSAQAIHSWKKILLSQEVTEIRHLTASLSDKYYTDADW